MLIGKESFSDLLNQDISPEGEKSVVVDTFYHVKSDEIIKKSIKALDIEDKNRVLELEHGSCRHLPYLMDEAFHIKYFGMEISKEMEKEASNVNIKYIKNKEALFQLFDGVKVPYVHNIFDRILAVTTVEFKKEPLAYLEEMFRVLKPGGKFVLAFTNNSLSKKSSEINTNDISILDEKEQIKELISKTQFILNSMEDNVETIKDEEGNLVDQNFTIVVLSKKPRNRYLELR